MGKYSLRTVTATATDITTACVRAFVSFRCVSVFFLFIVDSVDIASCHYGQTHSPTEQGTAKCSPMQAADSIYIDSSAFVEHMMVALRRNVQ